MQQITAPDLAQLLSSGHPVHLLDVREPWEVALVSLPDSLHVPMGEIPSRLNEVRTDKSVVCICHHGVRSMQVAYFLEHNGFEGVYNLQGGIDAWAREVDPQCTTY